jgi:hypothetical protein
VAIRARSLKSNDEPNVRVRELLKRRIDVVTRAHIDPHRLDRQGCSGSLNARPVDCSGWVEGIHQHSNLGGARNHFQSQRKLLSGQSVQ